ncbi:MAG: hypothetical protein LBI19_00395 [Oscillospiraceae bacterium]|jgi:hypothetical protein|nr:hypothetical protein [Oscillospiraceae bacterium]
MRGMRAFLLCAVLAALLSACTSVPPPSSPSGGDAPLVLIAGEELSRGEIVYLTSVAVEEYLLFREIDWEGHIEGIEVRRHFLDKALELAVSACVIRIKAAELGYALTDEEEGAIDWELAMESEYREGREAFLEELAAIGLTEELYRFYNYAVPMLQEKMLDGLYGPGKPHEPDDGAMRAYYSRNYISASYIYLSATDEYGEPLTGTERETQKSVAEALRRRAISGDEDFTGMVGIYGQDYMMSLSPEGMPIPLGLFGASFDTALSALAVNDISEVVSTDDGFYVILRLPEDWEWFEENIEDILYYCGSDAFSEKIREWGVELGVAVDEAFYRLDPQEMIAAG